MKNIPTVQLLSLTFLLFFLLSCTSDPKTEANNANHNSPDTSSYPFKATYSSDVAISAHAENLQEVLTIWKMFETKQIAAMKKYYADTVKYEDASGFTFYGKSDSLLSFAKQDIEGLDSLRFDISMWQNIHINDKNEDWVYIWAVERRYPMKGNADTSLIHEQWKIDNGKVSYFNQYKSKHTH